MDRTTYFVTASDIISQNNRNFQVKEHFEIILAALRLTEKGTEVKSLDLLCGHQIL